MTPYHYTECGLRNIHLLNGYKLIQTPRGKAVSIKDIDGLHRAIGLFLVTSKKDFSGEEIRFLRHELLKSQKKIAHLLGVSEQSIRRWEKGQIASKSAESLLRLLYREHAHQIRHNKDGKISVMLKHIADLEERNNNDELLFKDTSKGWKSAA
jgi:DNA-binding transcriptional regulator YiaG